MIDVRPATAADAPAVQRIYAASIGKAEWLPEQARLVTDFGQASVGEVVHVAATNSGEVLGFVSVQPDASFVHHLFIKADSQRQGIGRLLLASLEPWLLAPWRLKCVRANGSALAFYAALGWCEVGSGESDQRAYAVLEWSGMTTHQTGLTP